jgi:hypothetical protein
LKLAIELRLAELFFTINNYQASKNVFLRISKASPSATTWLGVGKSCYFLEDFQEAQAALAV